MRSEFDRVLRDLNNRKAPLVDGIPAELLKSAGDEILDRLCNIYESGELPTDIRKSIVEMIRKKKGAENLTSIKR